MAHALRFRGPDAQGITLSPRLGLAHTRLAIVDLDERSNQPIENDRWILCYNGEIVNFQDLRAQLESSYAFRTTSDTEVLLAALTEWGIEQTLPQIAGMFAFVAQDKTTGDVYAVRDQMGIKPLFISKRENGVFAFASSVRAILDGNDEPAPAINKRALSSFFYLGAPFTRQTVHKGIDRVPPATCVHIAPDGSVQERCFWRPRYTPDFTIEELVRIVREYQFADVPMALFLSGGVDSTFLACATDNFDCFHLTSSEEPYAQQVAERFGRTFHSVEPSMEVYEDDFRRTLALHGEPLFSAGIPAAVSRKCAEMGYKVALSANGADELFGGYERTPMPELKAFELPSYEQKAFDFFQDQFLHIFRHPDYLEFEWDAADRVDLAQEAAQFLGDCFLPDFPASASYRWFELMSYVLHDLNPTLDAASMSHSLEVRVPFLDHRVVEGVLSMDANRLIDPELGRKAPLKQHIIPFMGQEFLERKKLGFSIDRNKLTAISEAAEKASYSLSSKAGVGLALNQDNPNVHRDKIYAKNALFAWGLWQQGLTSEQETGHA
jgi:asparagine synthase (glutamine-hydrolysing)